MGTNFKVGDIVELNINENDPRWEHYCITTTGVQCRVLEVYFDNIQIIPIKWPKFDTLGEVICPSDWPCGFFEPSKYFKLVRIRNTKLSRKMYPNRNKIGEWLEDN